MVVRPVVVELIVTVQMPEPSVVQVLLPAKLALAPRVLVNVAVTSTPEAGPKLNPGASRLSTVTVRVCEAPTWLAAFSAFSVIRASHKLKVPSAKSLSCAPTAADERVSARKLEKHAGEPLMAVQNREILMPPSKNVPGGNVPEAPLLGVYGQGAVCGVLFTVAQTRSPAGPGGTQSIPENFKLRAPSEPPEPTHS